MSKSKAVATTGSTSFGVPASSMIGGASRATAKPRAQVSDIAETHRKFMADKGAPKRAY